MKKTAALLLIGAVLGIGTLKSVSHFFDRSESLAEAEPTYVPVVPSPLPLLMGGRQVEVVDLQNDVVYLRDGAGSLQQRMLVSLPPETRATIQQGTTPAQSLYGKVVGIADGDTMTVLDSDNVQHKIRLNGIDSPEARQAFGTKAREALASKVFNEYVSVEIRGKDKYGREIGDVFFQGTRWINRELVQEGFAWHYKQYSNSAVLADAEDRAKLNREGLWNDKNPTPPWDFRHNGGKENVAVAEAPLPPHAIIRPLVSAPTKAPTPAPTYAPAPVTPKPAASRPVASTQPVPTIAASPKPEAVHVTPSPTPIYSSGEPITGYTATGIPIHTGPQGGQYHYSKSGGKVYEKRKR